MTTAMTTNMCAGLIRVIGSLIAIFSRVKYILSSFEIISINRRTDRIVTSPNYLVIAYRNLIPTCKNLIRSYQNLLSSGKKLIPACKNFFNPYTHLIFTYKNLITTCKLIAQAMGFIFFNAPGKYQSAWLRNDAGLRVLYVQNNSRTLTIRS
jgi:hypothetical protein